MPRDSIQFFVDRSLGKHQVPEALRRAGALVHVHDEHFATATSDAEWIAEVGRRDWVVLTKDRRIRHRPLEIAAVVATPVKLFVLIGGELTGAEMAAILVRQLPAMTRIAISEPAPFIARVSRSRISIERLRQRKR